ncbi:hypothetical protein E6O75_ATG08246 [Venturia nashicola]|uniref:Uncharacterized protein n=1 Tax=Venturia nashicola TaxID=86259 RepID=A0A4Z1P1B7_9PEZI|nr:hypothetical protein E6O75_ATG08246 [Venturia nashicola]
MSLSQLPSDTGHELKPSSAVASTAPSVPSSPAHSSAISSPESVPPPPQPPTLSKVEPTSNAPAAKPTRTRAGSTTQPPVVETSAAAAPPPPPPVDSPPPENSTVQVAPETTKAPPQLPSQNSSPTISTSANNSPAPTSISNPKPPQPKAPPAAATPAPPLPVPTSSYPDPRVSSTKQDDYTTFRTVTNSPTSAVDTKFSSASNAQATKLSSSVVPESTAGKGTGVIASSPFDIPSNPHEPANASKGKGLTVGGVIGGLTAVALLGLLLFFLWKWRARRIAQAKERLSFGPCGNGIDASTGNILVASVPRTEDESPPVAPMVEKYGYIPPPRTRYFNPAVDHGRMLIRPIDSIEELSERGSGDVTNKVGFAGTNPFDDKHEIDRLEPTLPSIDLPEEVVESPEPLRSRVRRSQSLGSGLEAKPGKWSPSLQGNSTGVWIPPNMHSGNGQERYKNAPITPMRRYPTNPVGARGPMGGMQRNRRSRSLSGIRGYPRHNPVMSSPGWNRSEPMASGPGRRPSCAPREANVPVATSSTSPQGRSPSRKPSTGSLRERPSPTNWRAPDTAHPLHQFPQPPQQTPQQQQPLVRSNAKPMRLGSIDKGPELTFGSMWGTASSNTDSKAGDPARNF